MIQFENISKSFQSSNSKEVIKAIDNVTLTIEDNEFYGIIGQSGAGKSTLLRFLNGLERPDQGQIYVDGVNILNLNRNQFRDHLCRTATIFQHFNLLSNKTVAQNIQLQLDIHKQQDTLSIDQVLEVVGLSDKKNAYPGQLSGGQKQRVGIARALVSKPKILLCDEPTSALDARTTDEICRVLAKVHREFDMTILIVTHELPVVKRLCTRAAVLENGQLLEVVDVFNDSEDQNLADNYLEQVLEVLTNDSNA